MVNIETVKAIGEAMETATDTDEWSQLWFTLVKEPWTTLVIVPAESDSSALGHARSLAEAGRRYQADSVDVIDAERITPSDVPEVLTTLAERSGNGVRVLVAVRSPLEHAAAIPVARACEAAVLAVRLGEAQMVASRRTIDTVGESLFIGSIVEPPELVL